MTKQLIIEVCERCYATLENAIAESEAKITAIQKECDKAYRIYDEISNRYKIERETIADIKVLHKALKKAERAS